MNKITLTSLLFISSATLASAQATNSCNLIPNPSFEQQNVTQPSGNPNNIADANAGYGSDYNEVTSWQSIGSFRAPSSIIGKPTYYATNAPVGSATNPFTNPATNVAGSAFQPYNYNPSLNNGALSFVASSNPTTSPIVLPQYVTAVLPQAPTQGKYYASFQAYRSAAANPASNIYLGMNLNEGGPQTSATASSIESPTPLTNSAWTRVSGILTIPSSTNNRQWSVTIGNLRPNVPINASARYYIDEVELYKIPTAGAAPAPICSNSNTSVTLGEGCHIPNATYTWSASGVSGLPAGSSNIQITVSPTTTTVYTLKVNLPDGVNIYESQVTVTVDSATSPYLELVDQDDCYKVQEYHIANFNSNYTYTLISNTPSSLQAIGNPNYGVFRMKGKGGNPGGSFTLNVTGLCGSGGTVVDVYWDACDAPSPTSRTSATTAYPNPAAETIVIPEGIAGATLVSDKGKVMGVVDRDGRIDVRSLPDGLYNMQMMQNGKLINQRIQVKH
jgi:hypothetical protein